MRRRRIIAFRLCSLVPEDIIPTVNICNLLNPQGLGNVQLPFPARNPDEGLR